jgi:agmatine/peptidylarginine deiminase
MWIGFPSDPELWVEDLAPAQAEVAALAGALHADGRGEQIILDPKLGIAWKADPHGGVRSPFGRR